MSFISTNPYTNELVEHVPDMDMDAGLALVVNGAQAFAYWRKVPLASRLKLVEKIGASLKRHRQDLAGLVTTEMGKPIIQSLAEIDKCVRLCDHYAKSAGKYLQPRQIQDHDLDAVVEYHPLGVILGIMPWNFPFWQVLRFAIPAIAAGNTVLHKPAPQVPGCARRLQELMDQIFTDQMIFQTAWVDEQTIPLLISHPHLRGVALTGSDRAGRIVASLAGQHLKVCVMELGGSDPFVVLKDGDVDKAAQAAIQSRMANNGQTCIAAKRYIVHESRYDEFRAAAIRNLQELQQGDPRLSNVFFSCLSRPSIADLLRDQVSDALSKGAKLAFGQPDDHHGLTSYKPQLLEGLAPEMRMSQEEVFGPVGSLFAFSSEEEALELCHQTPFGLGASVWSRSPDDAMNVAREIQAGAISINGIVRSDPRVPFGGIKDSGFGRELGAEGIHAFCNIKSIMRK